MAYRTFRVRAKKARPPNSVAKALSALALSAFAYGSLVGATGGYLAVDPAAGASATRTANLYFEDGAPVITGSVAALFQAPVFSGPNRSAKTDRALPEVNLAAFSQDFDAIRLSIAEARRGGADYVSPTVRVAQGADEAEGRIQVASVDPDIAGAAGLRAIDALAEGANIDPDAPRPVAVPETLAYARANTPATDFTAKHDWSDREQWCLATGIYFEARGESYRGQVAVAQVIMNRVEHANYPDTICGVVYQNQHRRNACQFSFACDGTTNVNRTPEVAAWTRAQEITQTVLNKEIYLTEVADATHYHATYVRPHWARNMDRVSQIGLHIFYRFKPGWRFG